MVETGLRAGAGNAALLKVNQVGTVTERRWRRCGQRGRTGGARSCRARSGETEDVSIVHSGTGLAAGQLKVGSFARSERMAKWNEGLRVEGDLPVVFRGARRWGERGGPDVTRGKDVGRPLRVSKAFRKRVW